MDPLTWAMLALMVAGTGASAVAQHKTNKERGKVMEEERLRRTAQQKQSEAAAQNTAETYGKTREQEAARAAELATGGAKIAAPVATPQGQKFLGLEAPQSSTLMVEGLKDANARAQAQESAHHAALGKLSAFGDVMLGNNLTAGRNAQDIGQQAGFTQGWQQNVLPALLQKANMAGRDWATAGDVMKLAAAIMSPWALAKGTGANVVNQGINANVGAADVGAGAAGGSAFDPWAFAKMIKHNAKFGVP